MTYLQNLIYEGTDHIDQTDFFKRKGYGEETIRKYKLGYLPEGLCDYAKVIDEEKVVLTCYKYIIPEITKENEILYAISRKDSVSNCGLSFDVDKHFFVGANDRVIWNKKALFQQEPVFICETWTDALSVIDCGYEALALNRIINIVDLWKAIRSANKDSYILFTDNDFYGKKANDNLARMLESESRKFVCIDNFPDGIKDANEWMLFDRDSFKDILRRKYNELL